MGLNGYILDLLGKFKRDAYISLVKTHELNTNAYGFVKCSE